MGEETHKIDLYKLIKDGLELEHTYEVDGYDVKGIKELLKRELDREEPSVIIVRRPCILLYKKARWSPMQVDPEKCIKCNMCLKLGCPAITTKNEKAFIVGDLCNGCTVCSQVCPVDAIEFTDNNGLHIVDVSIQEYSDGGKK
jgi:indolepyruvate ferredoxin oxidoreductase alpha subunit